MLWRKLRSLELLVFFNDQTNYDTFENTPGAIYKSIQADTRDTR
jgi:hypothetical protein